MPYTTDYTPIGALSELARKSGENQGSLTRAQLMMQQDEAKRAAIRLQMQQQGMAEDAKNIAIDRQINQDRYNAALQRGDAAEANRLKQQEFQNQNFEENQAWEMDAPTRDLLKAKQVQERQKENVQWTYTEEQKHNLEQIQRGRDVVRTNVTKRLWTPEQAKEAELQLDAEEAGIVPSKNFFPESTPQQQLEKRKFNDTMYLDKQGNPQLMPEIELEHKKEVEAAKLKQAEEEADIRAYVSLAAVKDKEGSPIYTDTEIRTMLKNAKAAARGKPIAEQPVADKQADVEDFAVTLEPSLDLLVKGQKQGVRKKHWYGNDEVYGKEAYDSLLAASIEKGKVAGISPQGAKAVFNQWWDKKYAEDEGETYRKFADRRTFASSAGGPASNQNDPLGLF